MSLLDNPVLAALDGPHAHLGERHGRAHRYRPDVTPFAALPHEPGADDWADLATLFGAGGRGALLLGPGDVPHDWEVEQVLRLVQMTYDAPDPDPDDALEVLVPGDHEAMRGLVERTDPGPFLRRTPDCGRYLGLRRAGELAAMAGERFRLDGWTEVSAVCTDPASRGEGLAGRLVRGVVAGVRAEGQRAFLHVLASNTAAIRVYERIGFGVRREGAALVLRAPSSGRRAVT